MYHHKIESCIRQGKNSPEQSHLYVTGINPYTVIQGPNTNTNEAWEVRWANGRRIQKLKGIVKGHDYNVTGMLLAKPTAPVQQKRIN